MGVLSPWSSAHAKAHAVIPTAICYSQAFTNSHRGAQNQGRAYPSTIALRGPESDQVLLASFHTRPLGQAPPKGKKTPAMYMCNSIVLGSRTSKAPRRDLLAEGPQLTETDGICPSQPKLGVTTDDSRQSTGSFLITGESRATGSGPTITRWTNAMALAAALSLPRASAALSSATHRDGLGVLPVAGWH